MSYVNRLLSRWPPSRCSHGGHTGRASPPAKWIKLSYMSVLIITIIVSLQYHSHYISNKYCSCYHDNLYHMVSRIHYMLHAARVCMHARTVTCIILYVISYNREKKDRERDEGNPESSKRSCIQLYKYRQHLRSTPAAAGGNEVAGHMLPYNTPPSFEAHDE